MTLNYLILWVAFFYWLCSSLMNTFKLIRVKPVQAMKQNQTFKSIKPRLQRRRVWRGFLHHLLRPDQKPSPRFQYQKMWKRKICKRMLCQNQQDHLAGRKHPVPANQTTLVNLWQTKGWPCLTWTTWCRVSKPPWMRMEQISQTMVMLDGIMVYGWNQTTGMKVYGGNGFLGRVGYDGESTKLLCFYLLLFILFFQLHSQSLNTKSGSILLCIIFSTGSTSGWWSKQKQRRLVQQSSSLGAHGHQRTHRTEGSAAFEVDEPPQYQDCAGQDRHKVSRDRYSCV